MVEHEIIVIIVINGRRNTAPLAKRSRWLSKLADDVCFHVVLGSVQEQCDMAAMLSNACEQVRLRIMPLAMPAASHASLPENISVEPHDETMASSPAGQALHVILERDAPLEELPEVAIGQQAPGMLWTGHHKGPPAAPGTAFEKEDQLRNMPREVA